jgi:hypothetical protein
MSQPTTRARLTLTRLDERTVPVVTPDPTGTVTVSTTARPFDFVATGTLTATDTHTDGGAEITDTSSNSVTLAGTLDYANNTDGQAGGVTVSGTGTGTETPTPGGRGAYAQTLQGQWAFADANGVVSTTDPLAGTRTPFIPGGGSTTIPFGPFDAAGTFDVSTFKLQTTWDTTTADGHSTGGLNVTLANATNQTTDLAFGRQSAAVASDATLNLDFSVTVSGNLMKAASRTAAVTHVTAVWQGGGQTQTVNLDVPVLWNAGTIDIAATGLTPPAWAETLTVSLDQAGKVAEADETNNTWTITLTDLAAPPVSPPPVDPSVPPPPPVSPPTGFPRVPADPPRHPASFSIEQGARPLVAWRDAEGVVIATTAAFGDDFDGLASLAAGDVNHDGILDVVVAAGDGGGPRVRVLDGKTGTELADFFAYDGAFRGGVNVTAADLNNDGYADIVAGAGAGGGPHVRVFDGHTFAQVNQFFAYDPEFRGGVSVATADLNGDGVAEIITGAGGGGGPLVKVFDARTGEERFSVLAAPEDARNGAHVTAATDAAGNVVVTADPDGAGPVKRFRNQVFAGGPLLDEIFEPIVMGTPVITE